MQNKFGLIIKILLVVLTGATTVMTLLGAVGTTCLAWNGDKYPKAAFGWIVPLMPTFQNLVYVSLAAGVALAIVTYAIVRGDKWFYIGGLIFLIVAGGAAAYQMYLSSEARKISFFAAAPTNMRFYITAATLFAFLIIRIPGIWNKGGFDQKSGGPGSYATPSGLAMFVAGALTITAPVWAGAAHTVDEFNYVMTLGIPLFVDGVAMIVAGFALLMLGRYSIARQRAAFALK
jgi:hypothetical protein